MQTADVPSTANRWNVSATCRALALALASSLSAGSINVWAQSSTASPSAAVAEPADATAPAVLATPAEAARVAAARAEQQEKNWLDEIAAIEAETTIVQKREELDTRIIEAQTRVLKKREELETLVRETTAEMLAHLPSVVSITGMEGDYQSQVYYPSGRLAYVRAGDQLSPDVKVVAITLPGVEVEVTLGRNSERRRVFLNFITLADRLVETEGSNIREQVDAARDVVLPRASAEATAVVNVLRALAGSQAAKP